MTTRTDNGSTLGSSSADETSRTAAIGAAVSDAAGTVKDAAADAAGRIPDVAATTRSAIEDANRQMRAGSDEMLAVGSALSFGFAGGLLLGGANRLVVAGALLPAAMMVLTILDRSSRAGASVGRRLPGD